MSRNACKDLLAALVEVDDLCLRLMADLVDGLWAEGRIGIVLDPELNSFRAFLAGDLALRNNPASALAKTPAPATIFPSRWRRALPPGQTDANDPSRRSHHCAM